MVEGFYFITDSKLSRQGIIKDTKDALKAGVKFVQYRQKDASTARMFFEANQLRRITKGATFIINDRLDIALASEADGIHLGQDDMPYDIARKILGKKRIIGISVHNIKQAKDAVKKGADYLGVGPIFSTGTKPDAGRPVGCKLIAQIKKHIDIPIVAIGGINLSNARKVIEAGADSLTSISAVLSSGGITRNIRAFEDLFYL